MFRTAQNMLFFIFVSQAVGCFAFIVNDVRMNSIKTSHSTSLLAQNNCDAYSLSPLESSVSHSGEFGRRSLFGKTFGSTVSSAAIVNYFVNAAEAKTEKAAVTKPEVVAIIGGGGRSGMDVATTLARNGVQAVTLTRTGTDPFKIIKLPESTKANLKHYAPPVDVRDQASVDNAIKEIGATSIVFAASASKRGGTAFEIDQDGAANAAMVAKKYGTSLIVISSLAIDRPDSRSFKVTNSIGGNFDKIMDAKRIGEDKVREIMGKGKGRYVIIRPGPLITGKTTLGAMDLEINQGDTIGGGLSRDELAGAVFGALQSGVAGVTVEVYRRSTHTKLQPEFAAFSGNEISADTYSGLFSKCKKDV